MTDPLSLLRKLLAVTSNGGTTVPAPGPSALESGPTIDDVLKKLRAGAKSQGNHPVPVDLQYEAVKRFWQAKSLDSLRDARLVSFGLCLPITRNGPCLMEDAERFPVLLVSLGQWETQPRRYRRCFQGLVAAYFAYDAYHPATPVMGVENWATLRTYLATHLRQIDGGGINPDWVTCVRKHQNLFGVAPCEPYAAAMLEGSSKVVASLQVTLFIDDASWFMRELVMAQIAAAAAQPDAQFSALLPTLLSMLSPNLVLRDRGMVVLLDRYARMRKIPLQQSLLDLSVNWWGNPWLSSNSMRWGGVTVVAREMVTEWLKRELIGAFFTLLAEEGRGDDRRLAFWTRYAKSIDRFHFALGADARQSRSRDFLEMRKKMEGLTVDLLDPVGANNAFVMTIGNLVVVEFSGRSNALYGYDLRKEVPFDLTLAVVSAKDADNSLKNSSRLLWLQHQDGIHGFDTWEQRFEAKLRADFQIEPGPNASSGLASHGLPKDFSTGTKVPTRAYYSRTALNQFAKDHVLKVDDKTAVGGNLWVKTNEENVAVSRMLESWGFRYVHRKGWWK